MMKLANLVAKIGNSLLVKKSELQVDLKRNRRGNLYWRVYDRHTNKAYIFDSERNVRVWIENQYHNS